MALFTTKKIRIKETRKDITVYAIAYLLKRINEEMPNNTRSMQTLHKWERDGILPTAPWVIKGRRFYSQLEIEAIVRVLKEVYPLQGKKGDMEKLKVELHDAVNKARAELVGAKER